MSMSHSEALVAVQWRDVRVDQGNTYTRDEIRARQPQVFTTFGILTRDDAEMVSVAAEVADDGSFRGVTHVLRPLVLHVTPLLRWPKRERKPRAPRKETPRDDRLDLPTV
jgi:hypothetical protein